VSGQGGHLVSTAWLAERLGAPGLRVLDAAWFMPGARDAQAEFLERRIPGACRFDLDAAADPEGTLRHTLPTPAHFAAYAVSLGIASTDTIVVYDNAGTAPAARAWWMFKVFGHEGVRVLDGGLPLWLREGRPIAAGPAEALPVAAGTRFEARPVAARYADAARVDDALRRGMQIADARPAGRFAGIDPEPLPGLRGGHIPGSKNLPYARLLDADDGRLLPRDAIVEALACSGIDAAQPVICTCGSGVTACVLALALEEAGNREVTVYDGSWSEWATRMPNECG
jgi:thiosulfate/3-mercaptopyruvate sulfurtransferase